MALFDKAFDVAKTNFTIDVQLEHIRSNIGKLETRAEKIESKLDDIVARLIRLEALREADIAQLRAEVSAFKSDVDRAAQRLLPPQPPTP